MDLGCSRRWVRPEQTLARAGAMFGAAGITRLADITGLDRIGIPVWLAIRPNGRSLSGGQGKGVTGAAARASAVMESLETWHAERLPAGEVASFAALGREGALNPAALDAGPHAARWDPGQELAWLPGSCVFTGRRLFVPRQSMDLDLTHLPGPRYLAGSSNGLASGNRRDEAVLHGLYELAERDSERRWRLLSAAGRAATAVDLAGLAAACPGAGELLARVRAAGCDVAVFNCTGPAGLATYRCVIADREREFRPVSSAGVGTHGLAAVAALRAITEAAQSRATIIAGSRDDRYPGAYLGALRQVLVSGSPPPPPAACSFADGVRELAAASPTAETGQVLARLAAAGLRRAAVTDLTRPGTGIAVVKVTAEGMLLPGPYGR